RQDGEAAERLRVELLEDYPVADHVLDRVSHHGQRRADEVGAVARVSEGGEGSRRGSGRPAAKIKHRTSCCWIELSGIPGTNGHSTRAPSRKPRAQPSWSSRRMWRRSPR